MNPLSLPQAESTLPPAARHVAHVLQEDGPLSVNEIVELTSMPRRTAYWSLDRLEENGVVEHYPDPDNPRNDVYNLQTEA